MNSNKVQPKEYRNVESIGTIADDQGAGLTLLTIQCCVIITGEVPYKE